MPSLDQILRRAARRAARTTRRTRRIATVPEREERRIRTLGTPARTTRRMRLQNLHIPTPTPLEERLAEPVTLSHRRRPRTLLNFMRNSTIGCFNGICHAFTQRAARPRLHSLSSIVPVTSVSVAPNHITMRSIPPVDRLMHNKLLYSIPEGEEETNVTYFRGSR